MWFRYSHSNDLKVKMYWTFVYIFYLLCICREFGLQHTLPTVDDNDLCSVCLERSCSVAAEGNLLKFYLERLLQYYHIRHLLKFYLERLLQYFSLHMTLWLQEMLSFCETLKISESKTLYKWKLNTKTLMALVYVTLVA